MQIKELPASCPIKKPLILPMNTEGNEVLDYSFSLLRCLRLLMFPFFHFFLFALPRRS
jgi:hypothetical protein